MRVLFVSNLFPPGQLGGYEILCRQVRDALRARGHEVSVLTTPGPPGMGAEPGVHRELSLIRAFDRAYRNERLPKWCTSRTNRRVTAAHVARERPDVALVWSQLRLSLGPALALQGAGVPTIFTWNDEHAIGYVPAALAWRPGALVHYALDRALLPGNCLPSLDLGTSTVICRSLRDRLVAAGVPAGRARVIYQGIPLERFPAKESPGTLHDPARVLFVGQLLPQKGVHTLLRAFASLPGILSRAATLTIVGAGPRRYERHLRSLASTCNGRVTFAGRIPYEELPAVYRAHDVFVFPSTRIEAFGLTFLEAMASGLALVASRDGGHAEVLEHEETALLVDEDDPEDLAAALARVVGNPALCRSLAESGGRLVRARFDLHRYVDEMEELLDAVHRTHTG